MGFLFCTQSRGPIFEKETTMMTWREVGIGLGAFALLTVLAMVLALSAFAEADVVTDNQSWRSADAESFTLHTDL